MSVILWYIQTHFWYVSSHSATLFTIHAASGGMLENTTVITPNAIIDSAAYGAASFCVSYKYAVPIAAALMPTVTPAATTLG